MDKLIVVVMGPGKKEFLEMCFDSVRKADKILYFTSSLSYVKKGERGEIPENVEVYHNNWDESDKATNAKARNLYLNHLKENYPDDWCLVLDEDELLDVNGLRTIKRFIRGSKPGVYNVKMRHFIGDMGHEDATQPVHVVPGRLFKISVAIKYPEHSHPVLEGPLGGACLETCIWHLGHLPIDYLDYILRRYKQHANDSKVHTKGFLKQWKFSHLLGMYPKRPINPVELPKILLERFEIDPDEFYFANRGVEAKHFMMVKQWKDYFKNKNVLDCGCGKGPYLVAWSLFDVDTYGFDKSSYAIKNSLIGDSNMWVSDIITETINQQFDLVTVIDILEHLEYDDLDKVLKNIHRMTEANVLFSIPFLGDKNLDMDETHIIKEDKEWWLDKLSEYFVIKETPPKWAFSHQIVIGEKKEVKNGRSNS